MRILPSRSSFAPLNRRQPSTSNPNTQQLIQLSLSHILRAGRSGQPHKANDFHLCVFLMGWKPAFRILLDVQTNDRRDLRMKQRTSQLIRTIDVHSKVSAVPFYIGRRTDRVSAELYLKRLLSGCERTHPSENSFDCDLQLPSQMLPDWRNVEKKTPRQDQR
jgi:hypothetical protein